MEDPIHSIIEKSKHSISQEDSSNHSFFACEDNTYPEDDRGESPFTDGVLSSSTGIVICSAPETPNSNHHIASQTEEFKTPPEECRRSSSCEEPPRFAPPSHGDLKSDSPDSDGASRGGDAAAFDSGGSACLKNNMDKLGFSKARISEMMDMLSDGKVRVRGVLNVELEQFNARKRDTNLKGDSIQPPPKKLKALAERKSAAGSPKEIMKGRTVIPSSHAVAEKVQSTEPLATDQVEDGIDGVVAGFCDTDGDSSSKKDLALAKEAAEEGIAGRSCDHVSDKDPDKIDYDFQAEKQDEDEGDKIKNGKMSGGKEKGGEDDEGYMNGSRGKWNLPSSVVRPVDGGNVVDKDTVMRNLTDILGVGSEQTTKDGDDADNKKEKNSYSSGGKGAVGDDSAAKEDGEDTIKSLLEVLGVLTREIQRKYHYGEVDILETAKRHGMTFPRPRWWPNSAGDDRYEL